MEDHDKTKEQLINELHELGQKVTKLEACCTPRYDTETFLAIEGPHQSLPGIVAKHWQCA